MPWQEPIDEKCRRRSKNKRRRDCARRHCRPYSGRVLQRQRFRDAAGAVLEADKWLMRLNFHLPPGIGWRHLKSMIRKSGHRLSEKITLKQQASDP
jgi:hypothetical protein